MSDIKERIAALMSKAAGDQPHTGGMIALVPSPEMAEQYAVEGGELPSELHVTLAFLGEAADISESAKLALIDGANKVAQIVGPIDARVFAVNIFNPKGEEPCVVLGLGGQSIADAHMHVENLVKNPLPGFELPENHAPWIPHMTLRYFRDEPIDYTMVRKVAEGLPETVPLTAIRVAFGSNYTDFPLSGGPVPAEDQNTSETKPTMVYEKAQGSSVCKFCGRPSTRKLVGDNDKTIFTCVEHTDDGKEWFSAMTEEDDVAVEKKVKQKLGNCRYCKKPATHKIGIDGGAWMGTCDEHEERGRRAADGEGPEGPTEIKVVRHVRTPAGVRRFKQPIGSVIVADGRSLPNLKVTGNSDYEGWVKVKGTNGKNYEVGKDGNTWYATGAEGGWDDIVAEGSSEEAVYKKLNSHIGIEGNGAPKKPTTANVTPSSSSNLSPAARKKAEGLIHKNLKSVKTDYEGWEKFKGKDGNDYYIADNEDGTWTYADADDEIDTVDSRQKALKALDDLAGGSAKGKGGTEAPGGSESTKATSKVDFEIRDNPTGPGKIFVRIQTDSDGRVRSTLVSSDFGLKGPALQAQVESLRKQESEDPGSTDPKAPNFVPHWKWKDQQQKKAPKPNSQEIGASVRDIYSELAGGRYGSWVNIKDVRRKLKEKYGDLPRVDVDKALEDLLDDDAVRMDPEIHAHRLKAEDHEAAVRIGGQWRHKLFIASGPINKTSVVKPAAKPNPNGSKEGVGGQGHLPADPDKVVLSKPRELQSGMMVNIGNGGWKRIGLVGKETRSNAWGGRGVSTSGQYTVYDPWGEAIAIMSPNSTVEVDEGAGILKGMQPKLKRRPWPDNTPYIEEAEGVAGLENPFVDSYPDFGYDVVKIPGTRIRYTINDNKNENTITVTRYERGKEGEAVVLGTFDKGTTNESRFEARTSAGTLRNKRRDEEAEKLGVGKWTAWTVKPQKRRDPKTRKAPDKPQTVQADADNGSADQFSANALKEPVLNYERAKPKSKLPTPEESAAAARDVQKTQAGRDLRRGVIAYQQKSGEVKVLQNQWMKVVGAGGSSGSEKRDAELRSMAQAIRQAPSDDRDLYRGFSLPADVDVNTWLGTEQILPVTSFSSDRRLARTFKGPTLKHGRRQVNVTLKANGRKALPIEVFGTPKYAYEREWLTAGKFKVTKVEQRQGHWYIEMEQTAVFDEGA